jgi:hypothetical protein
MIARIALTGVHLCMHGNIMKLLGTIKYNKYMLIKNEQDPRW